MAESRKQSLIAKVAGQVRASRPLALALPCAALAALGLAATVRAQTPEQPKCAEAVPLVPGFDSLAPQTRPACLRIRI